MGASFSKTSQYATFSQRADVLEPEDWNIYLEAGWRSVRSKELDKFGGLNRPAVARSRSMTAKLEFLQTQLGAQAKEIQDQIQTPIGVAPAPLESGVTHDTASNTARVTTDRRIAHDTASNTARSVKPHDASPNAKLWLSAAKSMKRFGKLTTLRRGGTEAGHAVITKPVPGVAAWRVKTHEARRRVMMTIMICNRFWHGRKNPKRLRRVDSFSYFIPVALKADLARFVANTQEYSTLLQKAAAEADAAAAAAQRLEEERAGLLAAQLAAEDNEQHHRRRKYKPFMFGGGGSGHISHRKGNTSPIPAAAPTTATKPSSLKTSKLPKKQGNNSRNPITASNPGINPVAAAAQLLVPHLSDDTAGHTITSFSPGQATTSASPSPMRPVLESLPAQQYEGVTSVIPAAMQLASSPLNGRAALLEPLNCGSPNAVGSQEADQAPLCPSPLAPTSKFGFTSAHNRALMPKRAAKPPVLVKEVKEEKVVALENGRVSPGLSALMVPDSPPLLASPFNSSNPTYPSCASPEVMDISLSSDSNTGLSVLPDPLSGAASGDSAAALLASGRLKLDLSGLQGKVASSPDEEYMAAEGDAAAAAAIETQRQNESMAAQKLLEDAWEAELHSNAPDQGTASIESVVKLMSMYVNRANAAWGLARQWQPATVWEKAKQDEWMTSEDWTTWKARALHCLRDGGFAVQLFAAEAMLQLPGLTHPIDLWTCDPWRLLHHTRPGSTAKGCIPDVPYCVRLLHNLAVSIEAVAGKEGLQATTVILHLSQAQFEEFSLLSHHNYGGVPYFNIFILVQQPRPGYKFEESQRLFKQGGQEQLCGSGYSLMQLNWVAEAWQINKHGELIKLLGTMVEELYERGVQWLVSHSVADVALMSRGSWVDLITLPFLMSCHKAAGVSALTQVVQNDSLGLAARTNGSLVMATKDKAMQRYTASATHALQSSLHPAAKLLPVRELRAVEICSGSMKDVVRNGKLKGTHYLIGLDRHIIHLHDLAVALTSPDVVRAKLIINDGAIHVKLNYSDITGNASIRTLAVQARTCPTLINAPADLEELLPLLRAQDAHAAFRKLLGARKSQMIVPPSGLGSPTSSLGTVGSHHMQALQNGTLSSIGVAPSAASLRPAPLTVTTSLQPLNPLNQQQQFPNSSQTDGPMPSPALHRGHNTVVFISNNNVSSLAVEAALAVAKPGRDIIHLVTVVTGYMHVQAGQTLLEPHYSQVARALVEARQEVLVLDSQDPQLVSSMEHYVEAVNAEMVVMATKALASNQAAALLGSVTLSAIKRLRAPVLVVNANSLNVQEALKHNSLRAMALVHRHSQPLVQYLCNRVLQPSRGDNITLCKVQDPFLGGVIKPGAVAPPLALKKQLPGLKLHPSDPQKNMFQRALTAMHQAASMAGLLTPQTLNLDSDRVDNITAIISKEKIHLLAFALPAKSGAVPEQLVHLLHNCRAAVLVYKQQPSRK